MNSPYKQYREQVDYAVSELKKLHPELFLKAESDTSDAAIDAASETLRAVDSDLPAFQPAQNLSLAASGASRHIDGELLIRELVIVTNGRPAMLIRNGDYDLASQASLPQPLSTLLYENRRAIRESISGVGRIEVSGHPRQAWLGTGFIVNSPDNSKILITNRHVASEIAVRSSDGRYHFINSIRRGVPVSASVDFNEEVDMDVDSTLRSVPILEVLHIEPVGGPDLAFMRLADSTVLQQINSLTLGELESGQSEVCVVGYPAKDTRETSLEAVWDLLGNVYNKKRLAPGMVKSSSPDLRIHDCSTLGGNSGSPLINLHSGNVVGMHFGGVFPNPKNLAVPSVLIAQRLEEVMSVPQAAIQDCTSPTQGNTGNNSFQIDSVTAGNTSTQELVATIDTHSLSDNKRGQVSVEIPLRISIELGAISEQGVDSKEVLNQRTIDNFMMRYGSLPGLVAARGGVAMDNGRYTQEKVLVVLMDYSVADVQSTLEMIPSYLGSTRIQTRPVSAADLLQRGSDLIKMERVPRIKYEIPTDLELQAVDDEMFAVFHVSPDAGWTELREFLSRTKKSLTIALYNFGTEHVKSALIDAIADSPKTLDLVLGDAFIDRDETDAFEREFTAEFKALMGDRFQFELADGRNRMFAGHYHTKVAVRDSRALWLSSGNWEPSNQPEVDPVGENDTNWTLLNEKNREWHAVILNRQLAETFESYIKYDLKRYGEIRTGVEESASAIDIPRFLVPTSGINLEQMPGDAHYFAPLVVHKRLRIQPLMTPDNYLDHVTRLVDSAEHSILLQNQTLKWRQNNVDPRFEVFMQALLRKHRAGVAVRFILRSDYSPEMKEMLIEKGFDAGQIRMLSRCHTKGMIVDSKKTLLGSHNLSEHGALVNRDASLIVEDSEVAEYFSRIFDFDWNRASRRALETPPGIKRFYSGDVIPEGYEVVTLFNLVM